MNPEAKKLEVLWPSYRRWTRPSGASQFHIACGGFPK